MSTLGLEVALACLRDWRRYQLAQAGAASGDVVVAITEGGETSFVIGAAYRTLDVSEDHGRVDRQDIKAWWGSRAFF
jgi:hypothetical protein